MRSQNVPLSASIIQEKTVFAKELNTENFQASDGWLRRWKERNNKSFKTVSGESKSVTPNKTYKLKSKKALRGKLSIVSITSMTAAIAMGHNLPMFVIGKAKNPRCLKNVKFLPCRYRNQQKIWMDGKLFEGWPQTARQDVCFWRKKCRFCDRQLPSPFSYWRPKAIKLYSYHLILLPGPN